MNIRKSALLLVVAMFCSGAFAVPITCDMGIESNVSGSTGCQLGSTNNDFLNPLQVNADIMFGYDDWIFGQKGFDSDTSIDLGLTIIGDAISGAWGLDVDIWSTYSDVMLVIKGGQGNTTVPTYVGYLLDFGTLSGDYLSPFANPNNGNLKEISHVSIYVRMGDSMIVSEPSILMLLGMGLLAAGIRARRRLNK